VALRPVPANDRRRENASPGINNLAAKWDREPGDGSSRAPQGLGETPIIDEDGDGPSVVAEPSLGLDPGNPDDDGFFDGDEWNSGTSKNDTTSAP
jgi:hypothetical protein